MTRINLNGFSVTFEELESIMALASNIDREYNNDIEFTFNIDEAILTATKLVSGKYWLHVNYVANNHGLIEKLNKALAGDDNE